MSKRMLSKLRSFSPEQETIYLIEQQLKTRRFFDDLERIGLGNYDFEPSLTKLILQKLALDDGTDKTFALYAKVIDKHSRLLKPNHVGIQQHARKAYKELTSIRTSTIKLPK